MKRIIVNKSKYDIAEIIAVTNLEDAVLQILTKDGVCSEIYNEKALLLKDYNKIKKIVYKNYLQRLRDEKKFDKDFVKQNITASQYKKR